MTGSVLWGSGHPGLGSWLVVSAVGLAISSAYINQRNNAIDRARNERWPCSGSPCSAGRAKPAPWRKSKLRLVLLLALLAGAGSWIYSGRVEIPASVAAWLPRPAPLSEEEKLAGRTRRRTGGGRRRCGPSKPAKKRGAARGGAGTRGTTETRTRAW